MKQKLLHLLDILTSSESEIGCLAVVEMLSLPQRLYSVLCPAAADTSQAKFNKQTVLALLLGQWTFR